VNLTFFFLGTKQPAQFMSVSPSFDGIQAPDTNVVAADFKTAFVGDPYNYSAAMSQQAAMQVPLGSQLALLTAANSGNSYVQGNRIDNVKLGSLANVLQGYGTLAHGQGGAYYSFAGAYGKF
jgi:hypothetical protein